MDKVKPFCISKQVVYDAYKRVKANGGAAGVDGQSIADFDADLGPNLYKIWNRMSSGSYFPPPVRAVAIAKRDGGTRSLGIPTVADQIAQTVVKLMLEPRVEPHFHRRKPRWFSARTKRGGPRRSGVLSIFSVLLFDPAWLGAGPVGSF